MDKKMTGNPPATDCAGCFYRRAQPMAVSFMSAPQMFYRLGAAVKTAQDFPQNFYKQKN